MYSFVIIELICMHVLDLCGRTVYEGESKFFAKSMSEERLRLINGFHKLSQY